MSFALAVGPLEDRDCAGGPAAAAAKTTALARAARF